MDYRFAETSSHLKGSLHCSLQSSAAMRFGDLPAWAIKICNAIREVVLSEDFSELMDTASYAEDEVPSILPPSILWREPLFDQLIVNIYQPGNLCSC